MENPGTGFILKLKCYRNKLDIFLKKSNNAQNEAIVKLKTVQNLRKITAVF